MCNRELIETWETFHHCPSHFTRSSHACIENRNNGTIQLVSSHHRRIYACINNKWSFEKFNSYTSLALMLLQVSTPCLISCFHLIAPFFCSGSVIISIHQKLRIMRTKNYFSDDISTVKIFFRDQDIFPACGYIIFYQSR